MAYPLMVLILAVLVSGSAAFSAYGDNSQHPLVDQPSQRAAYAFTIATAAYLATLALFIYGAHGAGLRARVRGTHLLRCGVCRGARIATHSRASRCLYDA